MAYLALIEKDFEFKRTASMNYAALHIIQSELEKLNPSEKFVVFAGAAHVTKSHQVPGLAELLNCPSLIYKEDITEDKEGTLGNFTVVL